LTKKRSALLRKKKKEPYNTGENEENDIQSDSSCLSEKQIMREKKGGCLSLSANTNNNGDRGERGSGYSSAGRLCWDEEGKRERPRRTLPSSEGINFGKNQVRPKVLSWLRSPSEKQERSVRTWVFPARRGGD